MSEKITASHLSRTAVIRPVEVTVRYITRRGQWFGTSWKGDPFRSGTIIFNIGIHLLDGLTWAIGAGPEVVRAHADPAGDRAEGKPGTEIAPPAGPPSALNRAAPLARALGW